MEANILLKAQMFKNEIKLCILGVSVHKLGN